MLLATTMISPETFAVQGSNFVLNGKPFVVRSGEMHYPRVPEAYWRDRMRKAKAMGLNTICTYVFWNLHERTPGKFDFTGNLNLSKYLKIAQEEGLLAIVRPGPYICTELDFGGFPAWLLKDRSLVVRSKDPKFLEFSARYMKAVGKHLQPNLLKNGGNVIMVQVENEYGSYGSDHVYMGHIRDQIKAAGMDAHLFTSDGPSEGLLRGGTLPDLTATANFGGGADGAFKDLMRLRPGTPRMIGEYWCGWFDHWGKRHHRTNIANHVRDLAWCVENGVSFNLYMFHGGTNWGFMQGSNGGAGDYGVDTTSYDYDAPLDEAGRVTAKYLAFQNVLNPGAKQAEPTIPTIAIPAFQLTQSTSLWDIQSKEAFIGPLKSFEDLDQAHGLMLYENVVTNDGLSNREVTLDLGNFGDYAMVFVNQVRVGTLDRRNQERQITFWLAPGTHKLTIAVESLSRVNFGGLIPTERKGLHGPVTFQGASLGTSWAHRPIPLSSVSNIAFRPGTSRTPALYAGSFQLKEVGDTFFDLRNFTKGFLWVNGRNMGRFWRIGPQQTLYVPGCWLKKGKNTVVVYDDGPSGNRMLSGLKEPVLDEVAATTMQPMRKPGQNLSTAGLPLVAQGTLPDSKERQEIVFGKPAKGRYLVLEALSEQQGEAWTTAAEIWAIGENGKDLDRKGWSVIYADSEELESENGSAKNLIDNQPTTIWHTNWSGDSPKHPHSVVIDLGAEVSVRAIRVLPRQTGVNGRIKDYRVYFSSKIPAGIGEK